MSSRTLTVLGHAARLARRIGLASVLASARDAADRVLLAVRYPPLRLRVGDIELRGFLRHRSFLAHLARGYEEYLGEVFAEATAPGTTVVDGGAHMGFHTVTAAKQVGPTGRVLAFEPDPYNYAALVLNVRRNGCGNVTTRRAALAEGPGVAVLHQSLGTVSTSLAERDARFGPFREVETDLTSLDHELAGITGPLAIKLDLEGAEPRALAGMKTLAGRPAVVCIVEINPDALASAGSSADAVVDGLRALGLEPRWIDETSRTLLPVGTPVEPRKGNVRAARP
jgi:FkbM family methyltransferase